MANKRGSSADNPVLPKYLTPEALPGPAKPTSQAAMRRIPLIALDNADVVIGGRHLLHSLNFRLYPGEHWAVAGENGAGKSLFFKLLRGDIWPVQDFSRNRPQRLYAIGGEPSQSPIGAKEKIAIISPEMRETYRRTGCDITAAQAVASGLTGGMLAPPYLDQVEREAVASAISLAGLDKYASRSVLALSQGQLTRVLLARALTGSPDILICDEAADGLDARVRRNFATILESLAGTGLTILTASHRPEEIPGFVRNAVYLHGGRIKRQGPTGDVLAAFAKDHRKSVQPAGRAIHAASDAPGKDEISSLAAKPGRVAPDHAHHARDAKTQAAPVRSTRAPILIRLRGVDVVLGETMALSGIDWTIRRGEHWALTGDNGAGKSTLLRLIAGDLHAHAGFGRIKRFPELSPSGLWELRAVTGLVSWDLQADLRLDQDALHVVASGLLGSYGLFDEPDEAGLGLAAAAMRRLGATRLVGKTAASLSHGQLRKILICRAMVHNPQLLLLDEPLGGLDARSRRATLDLLDRLAASGTTLVIATHHDDDLPRCVTNTLRLDHGRIAVIDGVGV